MNALLGRSYRLVARDGPGIACDENGVALGSVSLVQASADEGSVFVWSVRPIEDLRTLLQLAYGAQSQETVERCHGTLGRAAAWLDAGDFARAALETVMIGLPDLTSQAAARLAQFAGLEKAGDGWENQPRVPAGETGGGQWTDGDGGSGSGDSNATSEGAQAERTHKIPLDDGVYHPDRTSPTLEDVANRDYHDQVVAKIARIVRKLGATVETEMPLVAVNGTAARTDIMMMTPDGRLFLIEVKTGLGPKFEDTQQIIYPMAMLGNHVFSPDPRILKFGFEPGELLPPMGFDIAYKKDKKSRLSIVSPDGRLEAESK